MPELPEVETVRRQLEPRVTGRRIRSLEVLDERWARPEDPERIERVVAGEEIAGLERRGKYLLVRLRGGLVLALHLRMTGNLILLPGGEDRPAVGDPRLQRFGEGDRHLRARICLDDGSELRFVDPRRFGRGILLEQGEVDPYFAERLGPEPLSESFTAEALGEAAAGRTAPLKSFLLDQGAIAGIGNIYADEALFRARLHPLSPAGSMRAEHHRALREGIVAALEAGITNGGASIDDYRDSGGDRGRMQDELLVHRREGLPCPRCGEPIRRLVVAGRATYLCPSCQVRLRGRRRRATGRSRRRTAG